MGGRHLYLIAFGSNRRHFPIGKPGKVLSAASVELQKAGVNVLRAGPLVFSRPLGPSRREYANSVVLADSGLEPDELMDLLKRIERKFGRRSVGQRWGARVLDLDIVMWDGGAFASRDVILPHPEFRNRGFVLGPAAKIAPRWRDPISGLTLRQLNARLTAPRPLPR